MKSVWRAGKQLWTRDLAREIRKQLLAILDETEDGDTVVIDAKGVEVFDYSFANELFGRSLISLPGEYPGRFLIVENLSAYTQENLAKALEGLNLAMIERKGGKLHLLGKIHPADFETFEAIVKAGEPVTAATLKEKLGIALTAVNERLGKLAAWSVIRRTLGTSKAGRQQYVYSVPE